MIRTAAPTIAFAQRRNQHPSACATTPTGRPSARTFRRVQDD
jgi:hypothetical protein